MVKVVPLGMRTVLRFGAGVIVLLWHLGLVQAREFPVEDVLRMHHPLRAEAAAARWETRIHYANDIWLAITNDGQLGTGRDWYGRNDIDVAWPNQDIRHLKIGWVPSLEFPPGTQNDFLWWGWMMFGCIRGIDTLVSDEWRAERPIIEASTLRQLRSYSPDAKAHQQYTVWQSDTTRESQRYVQYYEQRRHIPIGLEVTRTSYAWSIPLAKRFIIFDYWFKNIGSQPIANGAFGIYMWPFVINDATRTAYEHGLRTITGMLETAPGVVEGTVDTLNIAWFADNDGDPFKSLSWDRECPTGVIGLRILRTPGGRVSYNWWDYNTASSTSGDFWGPYKKTNGWRYGEDAEPQRDREWYRLMTNREKDYPQPYAAVNHEAGGWGPPPGSSSEAAQMAMGLWPQMLLSAGPFEPIAPGDSAAVTFALVAGAGFHTDPRNFKLNFDPADPSLYMSNLDFSDLVENARWADWYFDTPGYDTDGDGNRGKAYLINCDAYGCDSIFYKGDGVPDFAGPQPPFPPEFDITTKPTKAILRWNGALTEPVIDNMSGVRDFEGYRVYAGRFATDDQLSLVASWDLIDYNRVTYDAQDDEWRVASYPYSADRWRELLGDSDFDPELYREPDFSKAYIDTTYDTITNSIGQMWIIPKPRYSYWEAEDGNRNNEYEEMGSETRNMIQRVEVRDTVVGEDSLTYGVYEITIENLNPSVPLYFAVSTFDFGNYQIKLEPLESSPANNFKYGEPIYSSDVVVDSGLGVSVFPNPYKIRYNDAFGKPTTYYVEGFEGRGVHEFAEQDRRIHFINLPDTATIRIYSLDGDLIREIHHPDPYLTTYSSSVGWDLISRNTQAVVSGIYIWRVDSRLGTQMGKLVIIK